MKLLMIAAAALLVLGGCGSGGDAYKRFCEEALQCKKDKPEEAKTLLVDSYENPSTCQSGFEALASAAALLSQDLEKKAKDGDAACADKKSCDFIKCSPLQGNK
ncbi:MAG: hypothetical protein GMKNLPBB_01817 [Myxococcota bacterium]|nr:hypothetical protein [Myxococcota bacterium]